MLDGKMFFGVTGTPRRNIAFVNRAFADADPVPFTFAKRTTKSLILTLSFVPLEPGVDHSRHGETVFSKTESDVNIDAGRRYPLFSEVATRTARPMTCWNV